MGYFNALSITGVLLCILVALTLIMFIRWWSWNNAPGPWGIPVLGYYPFLKKSYHIQLHELTKKHGEAYRINIAGQDFLYLDTIKAIKEVHANHSDVFRDRPNIYSVFKICFDHGLVNLSGEAWRTQRKFFFQAMKESGLSANREELNDPVNQAVHAVLDILRKSKGQSVDLSSILSKSCTDSVIRLFFGHTIDDVTADSLNKVYLKLLIPMTNLSVMLMGNVAKYLICPWVHGFSEMFANLKEMKQLLRKIIEEHKSTIDLQDQPRDFIDCFLKERYLLEQNHDSKAKYFSDDCLIGTLIQAYGDGSSAIGLVVATFLNDLSEHPDVQDDIHEEIITVVGTERLPSLEDRSKLPLLNSTLKELQRISNLFIIFPGLVCERDTTVLGVKVKKGSVTIMNFWSAHHDPKVYSDPEQFDATRFMPDKPKLEQPILFGAGKRSCAGEGLVMAEAFLFVSAILQNFLLTPRAAQKRLQHNPLHDEVFEVSAIPRKRGRYGSLK